MEWRDECTAVLCFWCPCVLDQAVPKRREVTRFRARPPPSYVSQALFRSALRGLTIILNDDEMYACLRRFDTAEDGKVNFTEFCHMIADSISPGV